MAPPPQVLSVRELSKAISSKKLDPVYLLFGDEQFTRDERVTQLIDAALEPSDRDFNLNVREASELSAEDLDALLNTPPLLANRRAVVIRGIGDLRKGPRVILDAYLKSPADDLLLLLLENGAMPKGEKELQTKCTVIEFRKLSRDELDKWVAHHATNSLNLNLSPAAAALLVKAVGDDLGQLASELEKLAVQSSDGTVEVGAVEDLVGVRRDETLADLLDAIAVRDVNRSLSVLGHVLAQPKTTGVSVLMALTTQTMGMAYARALLDEGEPLQRVEKALFTFLSTGKGVTGRPWGEATRSWSRHVNSWTLAELYSACDALLRTDISLKESRSSSDEQLLASLVLELCAPGRPVNTASKRERR